MELVDLAYTPHPDAKRPAVSAVAATGASGASGARGASGGLAMMAAASLSILGTAAMLGPGSPSLGVAETAASAPAAGQTRVFAARETAQEMKAAPQAPVLAAGEPVALETRAESPLPVAAGVLGPVPADPAPAPAPVAAAREQHTLVGFDGVTTMTDGPATQGAPAPQYARNDLPEASAARPSFPPPPVVWNNPIQWISVHKQGL